MLQLEDGRDKVVLNRDDAAGFRLDTTYTHKQHKILADTEEPELTTRTDYVNKYASVLQRKSYLLMGTESTVETPVGVAKPHTVFEKTQLSMLLISKCCIACQICNQHCRINQLTVLG